MAQSTRQQPDEPLHHGRMTHDEMEAAIQELLAWKRSFVLPGSGPGPAIEGGGLDFNRPRTAVETRRTDTAERPVVERPAEESGNDA